MRKPGTKIDLDLGDLPILPPRWKWGRVEDAASEERNAIVDGPFGSNLKLSDYREPPGVPVLTTANLRGDYGPNKVRYISHAKFEDLKRSEVRGGDILVAKIGSCGLTGVYPEDMPSAIIPANLLKMTVHPAFSRKFVLYFLNSPTFSSFLGKIITATAQPAFNVSKFRQLPFPLVDPDEQRRIVAEIEKQLTRLEAGATALHRVQANLKRYRAAVLKAACEGRLVPTEAELSRTCKRKTAIESGEILLARILTERRKNWQGRGQYKEAPPPEVIGLAKLPDGWIWSSLAQLSAHITDGTHKTPTYVPSGVPFLSAKDIAGFKLSFDECRYIPKAEHAELSGRCAVRRGNVLITKSGTIGRVAVVDTDQVFSLFESVANVPVTPPIDPKFVAFAAYVCIAGVFGATNQKGVAVRHLHLEDLRRVPIPLPPLAEQTRIVAEVERRLSVVEELESVVAANLQRATRLRQSILQKAFSGNLLQKDQVR
jgi:type I restriction enzyme S subunit